eukprot:Seg2030.6 transcript_id=Seg2030.6/GoldUCD/mRNA.D3Y31 product="putative peptidyl-tRNA hydrolase PTRHD1" protein_id=Seg2030.6/GoldUCD/D3Y31
MLVTIKMASRLVQYVVVRRDLLDSLSWPTGAVIAQACHACTAAIHLFYSEDSTKEYLSDLDSMHKVVLEAKDKESLMSLSKQLLENDVDYKLWIEQPEDFPTCIATKPYPKDEIQKFFKKFKLYK